MTSHATFIREWVGQRGKGSRFSTLDAQDAVWDHNEHRIEYATALSVAWKYLTRMERDGEIIGVGFGGKSQSKEWAVL